MWGVSKGDDDMTATKFTAREIETGHEVSVRLSVATGHCCIAAQSVMGTVTATTDRAVQITTYEDRRAVWFPRKALVGGTDRNGFKSFAVAKWFTPDRRHWMAATVNSLAA